MADLLRREVCDSILDPLYTAYIDMLCTNLIVYDGIILPSAKEMHVVMCNTSVDPVQLAKRIVRAIVTENLNNPKIRIGVLLDGRCKTFNGSESEPESEHMCVVAYKSGKPYDLAKSNYTAVIMLDPHPITNLDPATPLIVVSDSTHNLDRLKHCGKSDTIEYKIDMPYKQPDVMCYITNTNTNTNTNTDSDLTKLLNSIAIKYRYPYYKILCIVDRSQIGKMKTAFEKNTQYLHPRILMPAYDDRKAGMFYDLNNKLYEKFFNLKHDNHRTKQSGILFTSLETMSYCSPIELSYLNVVLLLNSSGLVGAKKVVSDVVEANRDTQQVLIVEPYRSNLASQISGLYECFYGVPTNAADTITPKQRKLDAYTDILRLVKNKTIGSAVDLNETRLLKLQALYGVKPKDYNYINRHNIAYVITLIDTPDKMCSFKMYEAEDRYLHKNQSSTDIKTENVTEPFAIDEITDDIPRWLGRSDGTEAVGSVLIFADEECNTVEYVRIVQISEFSRKHKRAGWTEKENRDKKILFLSQIYKRHKLTELKKRYDKPKNKQFGYMEKLYL